MSETRHRVHFAFVAVTVCEQADRLRDQRRLLSHTRVLRVRIPGVTLQAPVAAQLERDTVTDRARCVFPKASDRILEIGTAASSRNRARDSAPRALRVKALANLRQVCGRTLGAIASVITPADCPVCHGPLLTARTHSVCDTCLQGVLPETAPLCHLCGERLCIDDVAGLGFLSSPKRPPCAACLERAPRFLQATSFAAYDGALRAMIRLHKFNNMQQLATPLGRLLAPVLAAAVQAMPPGQVHLVAVPLFAGRGRHRRYNQSQQLADTATRALLKLRPIYNVVRSHGALRRTRPTESQSHLTPAQRRDNVRGAFAISADVTGWHVILIDDVYTTGATAAECTRVLLRAGCAAVRVVTLARTQPERVALWRPMEAAT